MKRGFLILFTLPLLSFAQKIELEGTYQGKNIYVQNPVANTGKGFCTEKVLVNGKEVAVSYTNAYEIKLDSIGFKIEDTIKIEIFHKVDCKPKVITPFYTPKGNFDLVSIHIDSSYVLHWITKNEINKLTYTIEQFRWNKWVKIGEVDGKGGIHENAYSFQTKPHSGLNILRVKQVASGKSRISKTAEIEVPDLDIQIIGNKHKLWEAIHFNKKTMYELYDRKGDIVKKGDGINIGIKGLEQNFYYLNYDNKTETITIRSK
jgi:hypothetical protein